MSVASGDHRVIKESRRTTCTSDSHTLSTPRDNRPIIHNHSTAVIVNMLIIFDLCVSLVKNPTVCRENILITTAIVLSLSSNHILSASIDDQSVLTIVTAETHSLVICIETDLLEDWTSPIVIGVNDCVESQGIPLVSFVDRVSNLVVVLVVV